MPATVLVSHPCFLVAAGVMSMLTYVPGWRVQAQAMRRGDARDTQVWRGIDAVIEEDRGQSPAGERDDSPARGLAVISPRRTREPETIARLPLHCEEHELIEAVARAVGGTNAASFHGENSRPVCRGGLAPTALRRVRDHIDAHLGDSIDLRELARHSGVSSCHFSRAFRQSVGEPPYRYVVMRRIDVAKARIRDSDQSLGEIARDVGFSDQSHFTRVFRAISGETPYAYRRRHR